MLRPYGQGYASTPPLFLASCCDENCVLIRTHTEFFLTDGTIEWFFSRILVQRHRSLPARVAKATIVLANLRGRRTNSLWHDPGSAARKLKQGGDRRARIRRTTEATEWGLLRVHARDIPGVLVPTHVAGMTRTIGRQRGMNRPLRHRHFDNCVPK